jgi:hypothetical protein
MSTSGAGVYNVFWDGVDDLGQVVPAGQYVLHVETSRERGKHTYRSLTLDFNKFERFINVLPPTEEGEYYAFQLVGLEVEEEGGETLGRVTEIASGPANDVLELDTGLALPLVDACVRKVDLAGGRILVQPGFTPR